MTTGEVITYGLAALGSVSVLCTSLSWVPGKAGTVFKAVGIDIGEFISVFKAAEPVLGSLEEKKP